MTQKPIVMPYGNDVLLIGRGATDDKGPVLGWVNVLQAHKDLGLPLPVNLRFCFEGMEESGSEGLDDLIKQEKDKFFKGVDAVCIVCFSLFLRNPTADSSLHIGTVSQLIV